MRKNRSLAKEVSITTMARPHSASLPSRTGIASSAEGRSVETPRPQGITNTFMKIEDSRKSFIQLPHFIRAYARPEYSSTRPSSIIEISVDPPGLSIGIRPFSTSTIMKKASRPSRWVGSTSAYGDAGDRVVHQVRVVGRRDRADGEEHQDQRGLGHAADPAGPARAEAAVRAGGIQAGQRGHESGQGEHERAADQVGEERQRQRCVGDDRDDHRHRQVAGERHERRDPEDPRRLVADRAALAQQLGQVPVGLQHARAAPGGDHGLGPGQHARV